MILFFLLLLDPPSLLHPRGLGCAVPGDHAPSASCATAILDRGPLFVSADPAEDAASVVFATHSHWIGFDRN